MSASRPGRPQPFQPRFTLGLFYLAAFFILYCLVFIAPDLWRVLQTVPPGPEQEQVAAAAAREAIRGRLLLALFASLATTALGGKAGWLPGMRPPR
jgi:ABC-type sulfate transport system permease component